MLLPRYIRNSPTMPIITMEYWNRSAYVTIQASPPLIKSQGATKRLAPPGVSKYIRGLTTYRFRQCQLYFTRFATVRQGHFLANKKDHSCDWPFYLAVKTLSISGAPGCHQDFTQKVSPPRKRGVGRACLGGYAMAV